MEFVFDLERIKTIYEIPLPHTKKSIESFLGQINFVKRFVPEFSQVILPLQPMIKKGSVFKWGDHEREALKSIKQVVIDAPSLSTRKFYNQFILYTFS